MILTYAIETLILAIILIALWRISRKVENGLRFLKKDIEYAEKDIETIYGLIDQVGIKVNNGESFREKVVSEEKRMMNYADESVHGPNHRFTTPDMEQKKKNHVYYMRQKAKKNLNIN